MFLDESGFMLAPTVRRTFAPIGHTPILRRWDRHDRISAISCVTVSPMRRRLGLHFQLLPDDTNVTGDRMVEFLRELRRRMPWPLRIVCDRGNVHDESKAVRAFLAEHPSISTEQFPSYTPEANPDEGVWQHAKHGRLANFTPEDTTTMPEAGEFIVKNVPGARLVTLSPARHMGLLEHHDRFDRLVADFASE